MDHSITTIIGVITLLIGVATFILTELDKRRRTINASLKQWQSDTISYLVDDGGTNGLSFEEIKTKYLTSAHQKKGNKVPNAMLQDEEIRRTLFELQSRSVLNRTKVDIYVCNRREDAVALKKELEENMNRVMERLVSNMKEVMSDLQERQNVATKSLHDVTTDIQSRIANQFSEFFTVIQEMKIEQQNNESENKIHKEIQRAALDIAGKDPLRYSADQISIEVMDRTKADRVVVMIQVISLLQNGILTQDGDGKISIRLFRAAENILSPLKNL